MLYKTINILNMFSKSIQKKRKGIFNFNKVFRSGLLESAGSLSQEIPSNINEASHNVLQHFIFYFVTEQEQLVSACVSNTEFNCQSHKTSLMSLFLMESVIMNTAKSVNFCKSLFGRNTVIYFLLSIITLNSIGKHSCITSRNLSKSETNS